MIRKLHRIFKIKRNNKLTTICLFLVWLCLSLILVFPGFLSGAEGSKPASGIINAKLLEGSWIRLDGGYVLELKNFEADGTLTAAYFNPQPIRVFQAFWAKDEGTLAVFIELRDVNYPGSKYNLRYDPAADRLKGLYFQAIEQQLYEIEFVRNRLN